MPVIKPGRRRGEDEKETEEASAFIEATLQSFTLTVRPLQGVLGPLEVDRHDGDGFSSRGNEP